jgi:hypothetical protein
MRLSPRIEAIDIPPIEKARFIYLALLRFVAVDSLLQNSHAYLRVL